MKLFLVFLCTITFQFLIGQVLAKANYFQDSSVVIVNSRIVNKDVKDPCYYIQNDKVFNKCAVPDSCIVYKDNKINGKCDIPDDCLVIKGGVILNNCAMDSCWVAVNGKIENHCVVNDKCYQIRNSRLVDICSIKPKEISCIEEIENKLAKNCNGCAVYDDETQLVYDAGAKKFYSKFKGEGVKAVDNLNAIKIPYKRPFRLSVLNLNRYLYNVKFGNSDVTYTSTESAVGQQYLFPGTNNGQAQPTNTYVEGASGNYGDNIFNIIQAFKPNVDRLISVLKDSYQVTKTINKNTKKSLAVVEQARNTIDSVKRSYARTNKLTQATVLDKIQQQFELGALHLAQFKEDIDAASSVTDQIAIYNNKYVPQSIELSHFLQNTSVGEINKSAKKALILPMSIKSEPIPDSIGTSRQITDGLNENSVKYQGENLIKSIVKLERYYNTFLDKKITAYSICTDSFNCCNLKDERQTYQYFDDLLTDISKKYVGFKRALNAQSTTDGEAKKDSIAEDKDKNTKEKPVTFDVNASDIRIEKGRITGLDLHQLQEVKKESVKAPVQTNKVSEAIQQLDSLWYLFEKSVSPEFVMRQILFNRNMVAENMKYVSPPIYPYGDRLSLLLQIIASDSAKKNGVVLDHVTSESLDFLVVHKPLFSFSAGTFMGWGGDLVRSSYAFQQVPASGSNSVQPTSPYKLVETGKGSLPVGINAMANLTWRTNLICNDCDFRVGFSVGAGTVLTPSVLVGYMFGGTVSIGTYQQLHLTGGFLGQNVNIIKGNYNTTTLYSTSPGNDVYNTVLKGGPFISLTYTLFTPKNSGSIQGTLSTAK